MPSLQICGIFNQLNVFYNYNIHNMDEQWLWKQKRKEWQKEQRCYKFSLPNTILCSWVGVYSTYHLMLESAVNVSACFSKLFKKWDCMLILFSSFSAGYLI
jgi:hypothetical protein